MTLGCMVNGGRRHAGRQGELVLRGCGERKSSTPSAILAHPCLRFHASTSQLLARDIQTSVLFREDVLLTIHRKTPVRLLVSLILGGAIVLAVSHIAPLVLRRTQTVYHHECKFITNSLQSPRLACACLLSITSDVSMLQFHNPC
jgi:hypothetical protein